MLGEDSHGKAEDMFNMMDKWGFLILIHILCCFSPQGRGRDNHGAGVHPGLPRRRRALSSSFHPNLVGCRSQKRHIVVVEIKPFLRLDLGNERKRSFSVDAFWALWRWDE